MGSSSQELGMNISQGSAGEPRSRALTTRRRGSKRFRCDALTQSQRHGRMSAESPDESGQVTNPQFELQRSIEIETVVETEC